MNGERAFPRVEVTFSPSWWHSRYGLDFGEPAWADPIVRTEHERTMRRLLAERFGDVGLGDADPEPRPGIEAYGHRFMAAFWGCDIRWLTAQSPAAIPLPDAHAGFSNLKVPDLQTSPVVRRAFAEAGLLEERYGRCDGTINMGGALNNAVSVFGDPILELMADDPEMARKVLKIMAQALLALYDGVQSVINNRGDDRRDGDVRPEISLGNCPVCMISPAVYRSIVLPVDLWYREHFSYLSLHHCGAFHPYVEEYKQLRPDDLDIGWLSDRAACRRAFPETPVSLMLEASAVAGRTESELDELLLRMADEAGPPRLISKIWIAEAGTEVSDENVRSLVTAPARISNKLQS